MRELRASRTSLFEALNFGGGVISGEDRDGLGARVVVGVAEAVGVVG